MAVSLFVDCVDDFPDDSLSAFDGDEFLGSLVASEVVGWKKRKGWVAVPRGASEATIHTRSCSMSSVPTFPSRLL